jgi:hypothetical protein
MKISIELMILNDCGKATLNFGTFQNQILSRTSMMTQTQIENVSKFTPNHLKIRKEEKVNNSVEKNVDSRY